MGAVSTFAREVICKVSSSFYKVESPILQVRLGVYFQEVIYSLSKSFYQYKHTELSYRLFLHSYIAIFYILLYSISRL